MKIRYLIFFILLVQLSLKLAAQNVIIMLDPQNVTLGVNETFSINIKIENSNNLGAFQFDIVFNTGIVRADNAHIGAFLGGTGRTVIPVGPDIDNTSATGVITFGAATFGAGDGPSGSGILATVEFTTQAEGNTALELHNVQVGDIDGQAQSIGSVFSGQLTVGVPPELWTVQDSRAGHHLYDVKAVSDDVAWVVGENATVLRTIDGGHSWDTLGASFPETMAFYCVDAFDSNTAFISGITGDYQSGDYITFIYYTKNGGDTWTKALELPVGWINDLTMFDPVNGCAIGDPYNGVWLMQKTSDGGKNWEQIPDAPAANEGAWSAPGRIFWLDSSNGWLGTNSPDLYRTTNGGTTWTLETIPIIESTAALAFSASGYGMAADHHGPVIRTTNGGGSWEEIPTPEAGRIRQSFAHNNHFWIIVDSSVYKSTDNLQTWEYQITAPAALIQMSITSNFLKGTAGWAVGLDGCVLKYENANETSIQTKKVAGSAGFKLYNNYPNPFNTRTKIKYVIPKPDWVKLTVYNLLGEKVTVLVDEKKQAGEYQTEFNAHHLPSGLYIYQLETDNFTCNKKLTLLK
ncbi:T9SS type A sorting domain-containing protein [candidate division KSB1 bacterium]|nr:T9SS type A sorting domain-containing protein [candidate division KSB1 bacterium]